MPLLTLLLDQIAALRESRKLKDPDPTQAAVIAELAGVDGVAIQLRKDRRYARERDLYVLREVAKTKLVVEMPPAEELLDRVLEVRPWMIIFSNENPDGTSGMVSLGDTRTEFTRIVERCGAAGIQVGFLVMPANDVIKAVAKTGASSVLIQATGYTEARSLDEAQHELDRVDDAVQFAQKQHVQAVVGRGVTYRNVTPLVELGGIDEFIIGHSILARGLLVGLGQAVSEMKELLKQPLAKR
jgi:pyridoxine 5-phosphate synthase